MKAEKRRPARQAERRLSQEPSMSITRSPFLREVNREHSQTQRPIHRCEFIPVGLLAILRTLARRSNGDTRPITFGPEVKR